MAKQLITSGDQFAKKGTTAWADWQRSRMKNALKDVNFEARQIVQVIRDMCAGRPPAWHLMTTSDGVEFRTFEQFITTPPPDGIGYPDYAKFRGLAISEPGVMNEREFDLLTTAPDDRRENKRGGKVDSSPRATNQSKDTIARLRNISRADPFIRNLFVEELIDLKLAAMLGSPSKKAEATKALSAIRSISRNSDDSAYRKQVNAAIRKVFAKTPPTALERILKLIPQLSASDLRKLKDLLSGHDAGR